MPKVVDALKGLNVLGLGLGHSMSLFLVDDKADGAAEVLAELPYHGKAKPKGEKGQATA